LATAVQTTVLPHGVLRAHYYHVFCCKCRCIVKFG